MISGIRSSSSAPAVPGLDSKDPKAVAAKVQAMFMEVMVKTMEDSVGAEDGLFGDSSSSEIYRGMFREQLSASLGAQLGGRLEEQLVNGMTRENAPIPKLPSETPMPPMETPTVEGLPVSGVITSPMGWRHDPIDGEERFHKGTDIAAPAGTPIHAVADGKVVESGLKGTYGNAVVIQTDDGRRMTFAHNQQNFVRVGDHVTRGDVIAAVGSTGRATGPHVHFEVTE